MVTEVCPNLLKMYDVTINSIEFLYIYATMILTTTRDREVIANYFHVTLIGSTKS
jgi:hypothetical protein